MKPLLLLSILTFAVTLSAQDIRIVKDISEGPNSSFSNDFIAEDDGILLSFDDKILFITNEDNRSNLWVSNGSEDSTLIIHSVEDGTFEEFIDEDENFIFYSLKNSEGLGSIYSISKNSLDTAILYAGNDEVEYITYLDSFLYFKLDDDLIGLDYLDGSFETVYRFGFFRSIRDINRFQTNLIIIGGEDNGTQLYISDGTTTGTKPYFLLNGGSDFSGNYYMTEVDEKLFFFYERPDEPYILYVTDGTSDGTMPLIELDDAWQSDLEKTRSIFAWEGKLFFYGLNGNLDDLYVSDGTVQGTIRIRYNETTLKPAFFTPYNGELYFRGDEFGSIFNLFKTDGTVRGTGPVLDGSQLGSGLTFGGDHLISHQGLLYFNAWRSEVGEELWVSNGTTDSTISFDLVPGEANAVPKQMTSTSKHLFFIYNSPEFGRELFALDNGTVTSTVGNAIPEIVVFPNPFHNVIQFDIPQEPIDLYHVEVYNALGQKLLSRKLNKNTIHTNDLPSGTYLMKLYENKKCITSKILIK